jgi:hypothetical protein
MLKVDRRGEHCVGIRIDAAHTLVVYRKKKQAPSGRYLLASVFESCGCVAVFVTRWDAQRILKERNDA